MSGELLRYLLQRKGTPLPTRSARPPPFRDTIRLHRVPMHDRPAASFAAREPLSGSRLRLWFRSQPLHRKFVLISMVKTTVVLAVAMASLLLLDSWRFQQGASLDAQTLATL